MIADFKNDIFTACLLFRCIRNGKFSPDNLWEESIVLIEASDAADAEQKIIPIAESRNYSYLAENGDHLRWEFFRIERIFKIDESFLTHGTELFSRHLRDTEAQSLLTPFYDE